MIEIQVIGQVRVMALENGSKRLVLADPQSGIAVYADLPEKGVQFVIDQLSGKAPIPSVDVATPADLQRLLGRT